MATSKQYTDEDYAAMEVALAARNAKIEEENRAKREAYAAAVKELSSSPEFASFRAKVKKIIADNPRDDNLSFHMDALDSVMGRIEPGKL